MNIQKFEATTMSSREIAELTGKEHKHVKRDIEVMLHDIGGDTTKFGRIYKDSMNRDQTEYMLPKNECLTLISGYSARLRHAIIVRWRELETPTPMTMSEFALYSAQRMVEIEMEQKRLSIEQHEIKSQLKAIVDGEDYFTVVGYCNMTKRRLDQKETARMGKLVTAYCNDECLAIGQSKHPNFGHVNSYPLDALKVVFGD